MPSSVDHNYYNLNRSLRHPSTFQASDDAVSPLPGHASRVPPSSPPSSTVAATSNGYASNSRSNGTTSEASVDPHDFYRSYQHAFSQESKGPPGHSDIVVAGRENEMPKTSNAQRKASALGSRHHINPTFRSASAPLGAVHPVPAHSGSTKLGHNTLKELVNQFNKTKDEMLPMPKSTVSRSTSTAASPIGGNAKFARTRTPSISKMAKVASPPNQERGTKASKGSYRQNSSQEGLGSTAEPFHPLGNASRIPSSTEFPYASQSMSNLHHAGPGQGRPPLFGEVLGAIQGSPNPGYGIPGRQRRRGSEGSMHTPNPMFPQDRPWSATEVSPSSPTAWYLGVTPSLDGVNTSQGGGLQLRPGHRRARSDFAGSSSIPVDVSSVDIHASQPPEQPYSRESSRRPRPSRIPLSSRRPSTSDASISPVSLRSPQDQSSPRSSSSKPSSRTPRVQRQPYSPIRQRPPTTANSTPRRQPMSPGHQRAPASPRSITRLHRYGASPEPQANTTQTLAFIKAPLPAKSPPLRSSKPRLPVSSASTSASRAKIVERYKGQDGSESSNRGGQYGKDSRSASKKIPDLRDVDFAARRDKIQKAFTESIEGQKQEAKETNKRKLAAETHAKQGPFQQQMEEDHQDEENTGTLPECGDGSQDEVDHAQSIQEAKTESTESPQRELKLRIDTTNLPVGLDDDTITRGTEFDSDDSPTLGVPGKFPVIVPPTSNDTRPVIDYSSESPADVESSIASPANESPIDPCHGVGRQRSVLSQILQMRGSSPPSPSRTEFAEDSASERDDQGSIHIMLGATPVAGRPDDDQVDRLLQFKQEDTHRRNSVEDQQGSRTRGFSVGDRQNSPMKRIAESTPLMPGHTSILNSASRAGQLSSPSGTPKIISTLGTSRSTMDSDAYSTVNRFLESYHGGQSPELAIKGGWDSKKVTQLYLKEQDLHKRRLEELDHMGVPRLEVVKPESEPSREPAAMTSDAPEVPATDINGDTFADSNDEDNDFELSQHQETSSRASREAFQGGLEVVEPELNLNRASLDSREDWFFTSPSIADWIPHQAADTPVAEKPDLEYRPTPPPKDWRSARIPPIPAKLPLQPGRNISGDDTETPRVSTGSRPQLPELETTNEGLGLTLPPQTVDRSDQSPILAPPPLPSHSPPPPPLPPPIEDAFVPQMQAHWSPPSPSVYSRNPPSSAFPAAFPQESAALPGARVSTDYSSQQRDSTPSMPPSVSSHSNGWASQERFSGATMNTPSRVSSPTPEQRRLKKRKFVVAEIVTTEKAHWSDMRVCDEIYRQSAGGEDGALKPEDIRTIFVNVDQVAAFAEQFLASLKQATQSVFVLPKSKSDVSRSQRGSISTSNSDRTDHQPHTNQSEPTDDQKDRRTFIGEVFCQHLEPMEKVYREFVKNQNASSDRIAALKENTVVKEWLEMCKENSSDLTQAWNLDALLSKPMQRITKYPLLLATLLDTTPEDHPDYSAIKKAIAEVTGICRRIDDVQKRSVLVQTVVARKRKDSNFTKAIGRRTEKLRLQAGLAESFEDQEYKSIANSFNEHLSQLLVVRGDVQSYTEQVQEYVNRFIEYTKALETYIEVGQSSHPEIESKWRKFAMTIREIATHALRDHLTSVRRSVIDPMTTLLKQHENPQIIMNKRTKRLADFARYEAAIARGEKPDRKSKEQHDLFVGLNETLKDELPRLFALTAKLVEACLENFVQIQMHWQFIWKQKVKSVLEENQIPRFTADIIDQFSGDFAITETQVLSLGICNGSLLSDAINLVGFLSPATTFNGDDSSSSKRPTTTGSSRSRSRGISITTDASPVLPRVDFERHSGNFTFSPLIDHLPPFYTGPPQPPPSSGFGRMRASSAVSGRVPSTPEFSSSRSFSANYTPTSSMPSSRPGTRAGRSTEPSPAMPRYGVETSHDPRPGSGSTYFSARPEPQPRAYSPEGRYSGLFSSAMPMSDSPVDPRTPRGSTEQRRDSQGYNVLFSVGSMHNFNIDRLMREAGYPYLTYVKGEIFDVLGEKGELWLAKNQDDASNTIGWIWNKHFGRLD